MTLKDLLNKIHGCQTCTDLPFGPKPVLRIQPTARLLIISQAPSTNVHQTGLPFNDASGDRLRQWLSLDRATFYDDSKIAFMPMGFCYPGRDQQGGDFPPRKVCAPLWHHHLLSFLPNIKLILLVGRYAQIYYLGHSIKKTITETVHSWQEYGPKFIPLPHPSWRNTAWLKRHPWFEEDILPKIRTIIHALLK
ncbi:uracil-DNA glycosylase family protein [Candidatus Finniella inopinata]|uniref:Uracil-DNA glycosylase family protein n=1 Tax=Candidatus Finniella inopinata TaxID=1696036 RepID=A0A4Q7DL70_9PROT|nr:uracil-DNA glycosylase family protein [Candidatus Finniella inopinata]